MVLSLLNGNTFEDNDQLLGSFTIL